MRHVRSVLLLLALSGCSDPAETNLPPGAYGAVTSAIVIVNPIINQGSTTSVKPGPQRAGVAITADGLPAVSTDVTGLAVVEGLPLGPVPLKLDAGTVTLNVVAERELYDVVLASSADGVKEVLPAVRYPIGGQVVVLEPGSSIAAAASVDNTIVVLRQGTYRGDFELTADDILIFGYWTVDGKQLSVIQGNITVRGGGNRMRGVKLTGTLTSNANGFSAAFCELGGANITGNGVTLIRNTFVGAGAKVPSSSAVLVDNQGIP